MFTAGPLAAGATTRSTHRITKIIPFQHSAELLSTLLFRYKALQSFSIHLIPFALPSVRVLWIFSLLPEKHKNKETL
jgi:hypothetical protein